jgi:S-DNA-T family DNA segregation ATPase FtsK/SpoIIIE
VLKLIDIPSAILTQKKRPADLTVPPVSIADHINYLPSSQPPLSDDDDLGYVEYESRSMDEIFTDEGQKALFDLKNNYQIPQVPEGVTSQRLKSIEKEPAVDTAIPAIADSYKDNEFVNEVMSALTATEREMPSLIVQCEEQSFTKTEGDAVEEEITDTIISSVTIAKPATKAVPARIEHADETEELPRQKIFDEILINEEYIIPSEYLHISPRHDKESWESEIRKNSELLVKTLSDFNIEARVSMVNRGPVVTLYEMQLAPGVKVTRVVSLSDDIAMALAASRVRVVAPIPGKAAIGIEVPNGKREMVTLGDIINTPEYHAADMMLKVIMGKDILGKPVMLDMKKQPHLLIAGATGAGKSVCVNGVIASLVCKYDPNHLRFIMIDPKMVELQLYNGLPHLLTPVITEPDETPKALKWAIFEMERRYRILSEQCVRDIDRYNQKIAAMRHPEEFEHLPYIIIIIDEFADLMMAAPKEMENYVTRIAQKARAIGIHVVLATQRPSVDIITGIIKANFPARVAFQVAQKTDSRTILDQNGAEKLLGKGDMLYQSPTSSFPVRIQGAYISEEEIMQIVQKACTFGRPHYIDFDEFLKEQTTAEDNVDDPERDEMFVEALRIVEETKKASASYLQRRLSIGYNRAARIIEKMEELGYVGPQQGSKPRDVFV